tara:strand:- start:57412 stop:57525 length:114 start_codon:yes stop_codon:yes gene_type:complete
MSWFIETGEISLYHIEFYNILPESFKTYVLAGKLSFW